MKHFALNVKTCENGPSFVILLILMVALCVPHQYQACEIEQKDTAICFSQNYVLGCLCNLGSYSIFKFVKYKVPFQWETSWLPV